MAPTANGKRRLAIAGAALTGVSVLVMLLGLVCAGSRSWAVGEQSLRGHQSQLDDHETRLRLVERQLPQMAADIGWIRKYLEGQTWER